MLGFLTVQSQALDRAIQRFPGQREELIRARTQFDNTFPQALARTRRLIAGIPLSDDERQLLIERALDLHQPSVGVATQTAETAHSLAERVVARAQGSQDRATLQTLLAVVYDDRQQGLQRGACLLYTSPSPRDRQKSRMPSSA